MVKFMKAHEYWTKCWISWFASICGNHWSGDIILCMMNWSGNPQPKPLISNTTTLGHILLLQIYFMCSSECFLIIVEKTVQSQISDKFIARKQAVENFIQWSVLIFHVYVWRLELKVLKFSLYKFVLITYILHVQLNYSKCSNNVWIIKFLDNLNNSL